MTGLWCGGGSEVWDAAGGAVGGEATRRTPGNTEAGGDSTIFPSLSLLSSLFLRLPTLAHALAYHHQSYLSPFWPNHSASPRRDSIRGPGIPCNFTLFSERNVYQFSLLRPRLSVLIHQVQSTRSTYCMLHHFLLNTVVDSYCYFEHRHNDFAFRLYSERMTGGKETG